MTRYQRLQGGSKDDDPSAAGAAATGATTGGANVTNGHGARRVAKARLAVNTPPPVSPAGTRRRRRSYSTACYAPADSRGRRNAAVRVSATANNPARESRPDNPRMASIDAPRRQNPLRKVLASQQAGLVLVILLLGTVLTLLAGSHVDRLTGQTVNNFLNSYTLIQTATDASFFAIMAVGATVVIISGGIDLSVGSIYALAGVTTAMVLRSLGPSDPLTTIAVGLAVSIGIGLVCGAINGGLVVGLGVHPFIITLGTMWIVRGIAFVASNAESILLPNALTRVAKASLGFGDALYPVP